MNPTHTEKQIGGPAEATSPISHLTQLPHEAGTIAPGVRFHDFEIVKEIGKGGFASVFLARQISLDRLVALKLSTDRGGEAQTLATLEHDHIVKVFTEFTEPLTGRNCLCLQYVPGTNLYSLIEDLFHGRTPREGGALVEAIDRLCKEGVDFDPSALHDRETLGHGSYAEAVCWIGVQLARALAYAHTRKILHCDIKPANILVNRYGKPMLVDFNVAIDSRFHTGLGGTLDYMAPETLEAIGSSTPAREAKVDNRTDLYSLGIVLFELATGSRPFPKIVKPSAREDLLDVLPSRETLPEESRRKIQQVSPALARVIERCLKVKPEERYPNGIELAQSLQHARELTRIQRQMPPPGFLSKLANRSVLAALLFVTILPNVVGSVINISYNSVEVQLNDAQKAFFLKLVFWYNLVAYPVCIVLYSMLVIRFLRGWARHDSPQGMGNAEVDSLRNFVLRFPDYTILLTALGWFPGAIVFPLVLDWYFGPVGWHVYAHLAISLCISGLVGIVYSYFGVQWIILHVIYPQLDHPDRDRGESVTQEMRKIRRWIELCEILAGLVPLAGAILLILIAQNAGSMPFRLLVTGLIVGGMFGIGFAVKVSERLFRVLRLREEGRELGTAERYTSPRTK
jgi:serine/threonine protein kinase